MHQKLLNYLTPMLGEATAANLLKHYCARMKVRVEQIDPRDLPVLADSMRPMLAVWLGSAGAARVAGQIAQLDGKEEVR